MSLRARPAATATSSTPTSSSDDAPETPKSQLLAPPSLAQRALSQTLTSTANLANLLPTGTLLAFQLLTPNFTNNGSCDSATRLMTLVLLAVLAASCFLASFTDSFKSSDGRVYYGFATPNGMWLFDYQAASASGPVPDLKKYKLNPIDGVHAFLSVFVFAAVALRDKNVLSCFYPMPAHETQEVLDIVPMGIGGLFAACCLWSSPPQGMVLVTLSHHDQGNSCSIFFPIHYMKICIT
ncbi:transmembrane protein, putative [Actinidia rufa]|uniref:Transmembrane protein, putative n=1 Tax=Actinidia rufa TaxID=165716 RepID=A0A7J0ES94_9ERIC|nr:transmembrane protein, putative [Actinidia rufa]